MERSADYLNALEAAILIQHKCKSVFKGTALVHTHTRDQQTVWEGYIEIFKLVDHPESICCYAWQYVDPAGNAKIFTILGNNFINSARKAVEAAIFIGAQAPARTFVNDLKFIREQLEDCKGLIHKMKIKCENLSAAIESARDTQGEISRRRLAA